MIFEDRDTEAMVLGGELDIAIPFSLTLCGEKLEVSVFPSLRSCAEELIERFGGSSDTLFSAEAIAHAVASFTPFLEQHGYSLCEESRDHFLNFRISEPARDCVLESTRRIRGAGELEALVDYDFDALESFGHVCFATLLDGKIVSAACTNASCEACEPGDLMELGVETAPEYRGRGLGRSNAAALAAWLKERGFEVRYECEAHNKPSAALAKRIGGELFARSYCVVGRIE